VPTAPAAGGAFIRAEFLDGGVVLRGVVPDEATRQRLRRDAAAIYGPQNVRSRIALDPALAPAPWLDGAAALAPARMLGVRRATLDGATLLLEGEVASGPARERALAQARAAVPRSIRVVSRLVMVPPAGAAPAAPVRELRAEGR
jgi:OOP family OmpA-OmpF porin